MAANVQHEVLQFWFHEVTPSQWWKPASPFDALITRRFADVHGRAARAELFEWRCDPRGRLAENNVLDQFSRNLYRGRGQAFAADVLALTLAQEAVAFGVDVGLATQERVFWYMPYMHSESRAIHRVAEHLFREMAPKDNLDFELRHKAIIDRFGRYPYRSAALGRESNADELEFLEQLGSRFRRRVKGKKRQHGVLQ